MYLHPALSTMTIFMYRSSQCVELDAIGVGLLHRECTRFLANRCYLNIDTETDFDAINHKIDTVLHSIDTITQQSEEEKEELNKQCGDLFLALTCNLAYPGCNPETNAPIGLCEETCLKHTTLNTCLPLFSDIVDALNEENTDIDGKSYFNCSTDSNFIGTSFVADMSNECYEGLWHNLVLKIFCSSIPIKNIAWSHYVFQIYQDWKHQLLLWQ